MDDSYRKLLEEQDWRRISLDLLHYCASIIKKHGKVGSQVISNTMLVEDVVQKAISLVISGKRVWNPQRGELIPFLKYSIIRSILSNAYNAKENDVLVCLDVCGQRDNDDELGNPVENLADTKSKITPEDIAISHENLSFLRKELQEIVENTAIDGAKDVIDCILNNIIKPREIEELTGIPSQKISDIKRQIKNKLKLRGFGSEQ